MLASTPISNKFGTSDLEWAKLPLILIINLIVSLPVEITIMTKSPACEVSHLPRLKIKYKLYKLHFLMDYVILFRITDNVGLWRLQKSQKAKINIVKDRLTAIDIVTIVISTAFMPFNRFL